MDLDGDGLDVISGSWPGELYFFRRESDGKFAAGEKLKDPSGTPISFGSASTVFAVDWDSDGDLDLLLGNINGGVGALKLIGFECESPPEGVLSLEEIDKLLGQGLQIQRCGLARRNLERGIQRARHRLGSFGGACLAGGQHLIGNVGTQFSHLSVR